MKTATYACQLMRGAGRLSCACYCGCGLANFGALSAGAKTVTGSNVTYVYAGESTALLKTLLKEAIPPEEVREPPKQLIVYAWLPASPSLARRTDVCVLLDSFIACAVGSELPRSVVGGVQA